MGRSRSAEPTKAGNGARPGNGYRRLPSVDAVAGDPRLEQAVSRYSRPAVVEAVRGQIERARARVAAGEAPPSEDEVIAGAEAALSRDLEPSLLSVINATGVVLHTNLGRAPLSAEAAEAAHRAAAGYGNLEMDLSAGERGSRHTHLDDLLRRITGAEAGFAVNNNAAAVMLTVRALARGRGVVVSRGEAVEVGGGFRIPDVLAQSDAVLVEVGTTNRTYVGDYEDAVTEETAAFLKVHRSNFRVTGFTHEAGLPELAETAARHGVPLLYDLGSGCLLDSAEYGLAHEPTPAEAVREGADVVMFSGDKLLGGPQAGIVVGKSRYIDILKKHPLVRAMRIDKATMAALQMTLLHYLRGEAAEKLPIWRMIAAPPAALERRAKRLAKAAGPGAAVRDGASAIGGGTLPGEALPTRVVAIPPGDTGVEAMAAALRTGSPPIVARIERDALIVDPRTVLPEQDRTVAAALARLRG